MDIDPFLPLDPLATTLGLPRAWLKREADAGRIPVIQVGARRLFDPVAVRKSLSERATAYAKGGTNA